MQAGVQPERLFLSYPGWQVETFSNQRRFYIHRRLHLSPDARLVGNINLMYPPKYFLGQIYGQDQPVVVISATQKAAHEALATLKPATPQDVVKALQAGNTIDVLPPFAGG